MRAGAWVAAVMAVASVWVPCPSAAAPGRALFRIHDRRIAEASGIAGGLASPAVYWVQNDSGNAPKLFAVDAHTGAVRGAFTVRGATNTDWEDIAVAADARGVPSIWIADVGDNDAGRREVRIYRVDEPRVTGRGGEVDGTTAAPEVWRLRYPDGPRDAEALAVAPGGRMWILDKVAFGPAHVFAVPDAPDPARVRSLAPAGTFRPRSTSTAGGPSPLGRFTVTGAALNREGTLLAVRTYTDAYVWPVSSGEVATAMRASPAPTALPPQPQGEGITIDAGRIVIDSEGTDTAVYAVALPRLPRSSTPTSPVRSGGSVDPSSPRPASHTSSGGATAGARAVVAATVLALVLAGAVLRRRRAGLGNRVH